MLEWSFLLSDSNYDDVMTSNAGCKGIKHTLHFFFFCLNFLLSSFFSRGQAAAAAAAVVVIMAMAMALALQL